MVTPLSRAHELAKRLGPSLNFADAHAPGLADWEALAELERLAADAGRYREALERIANPTSSPRTEEAALVQIETQQIARVALKAAE